MLFNSVQFLIFFPIVTAAYFLLPQRFRWILLLAASCFFYMFFKAVYILILAFTIGIDYAAGILIEGASGKRRRLYLLMSIFANVGVLATFKYYNFLNGNFRSLAETFGITHYPIPDLGMLLPIGLSFHTFQSLSYTIEVYRKRFRAERHFGIFALYVMFYPQLVAGPIERPQNLLHQFFERHSFDYERVTSGLKQMLWGFFKKVVIADRLAPFVNQVYSDPQHYPGISLIVATVLFGFQIYCDFSGYSNIAIGAAKVMGFDLMKNFDRPYLSSSISEFWRRWHISLSTWFRDYVYYPLGGSRVSTPRWYWNLMVTFLISGLWHGASWNYVVWGGLNGAYLVAEQAISKGLRRYLSIWSRGAAHPAYLPVVAGAYRVFRIGLTFALIMFSWIFFRSRTTAGAFYIASHLGDGLTSLPWEITQRAFLKMNIVMRLDVREFLIAMAGIGILLGVEILQGRICIQQYLAERSPGFRWAVYYAGVVAVIFFGAFNSSQEFIYFQF